MSPYSKLVLMPVALTFCVAADLPSAPPAKQPAPSRVAPRPLVPHLVSEPHPRIDRADLRTISTANRAATIAPMPAGYVNAMQVYPFADGVVYRAYTAPGQVTDIMLQPGEVLGTVASGDTACWVIGDTSSGSGDGKRTHILVKPYAAGLATNLVVTTDRRSYHVALQSTPATAMAALSWTYPQDQLLAIHKAEAKAEAAAPVAVGIDLGQLHFDYAISGDGPSWRPVRAFDDGRQTFIEFPATIGVGEAPPLFLVGSKGEAQLVNFRVQGRFYIVDRLFDAAELRLGLKHQDIVRIARTASLAAGRS